MALCVGAGLLTANRFVSRLGHRFSFAGRTVVITGGSRGLGLELARCLVQEQARVVLLARNERELERAVTELRDTGSAVLGVPCDVAQRADVESAVNVTLSEYRHIDVLINVAGVIHVGPMDAMTEGDFETAMNVHFHGPLHTMQAVIPHMRRQGGGRIVNVVSIGGKIALPHLLPYSASKFALAGLSDGIRSELHRDQIFVTTVFPGLMRTGSIYNAWFKGNHEAEFGWFAVLGSMPFISMNSARAARQIVEACRRGTAQLIIGLPARTMCILDALLPQLSARSSAFIARLLPAMPADAGTETRTGEEARSAAIPSALTRLSEVAAVQNNEKTLTQ
jgi:short-subunit dehydrogenase